MHMRTLLETLIRADCSLNRLFIHDVYAIALEENYLHTGENETMK